MGVAIPQVITEDKAGGALVIDGSLKFDKNKSQRLQFTPSNSGNRRTWTISYWYKNTNFANTGRQFQAGTSDPDFFLLGYHNLGYIQCTEWNTNWFRTGALLRDTGWYHIVLAWDSTQTTSTERWKFYINGVRQNSWTDSGTDLNYPSQNAEQAVSKSSVVHQLGSNTANSQYTDGHLSNVYFIDNQALDASYFGYTDPLTNTWRPKKLTTWSNPNGDGVTWSGFLSNQYTLYNNGTPGNGSNAFDYSLSTYAMDWNGVYNVDYSYRLEFIPTTPISFTSQVRVYTEFNSSAPYSNNFYVDTGSGYGSAIPHVQNSWVTVATGPGQLYKLKSTSAQNGTGWNAIQIDGVILVNGANRWGQNGFYLPLDGNTPIGQDQSGRGNNWTPVNFGGSNTIEKATGALPILNTDGGGKVARVGVRTDSYYANLKLAVPFVGVATDVVQQINGNSASMNSFTVNNATFAVHPTAGAPYGTGLYLNSVSDYPNINFSAGTFNFLHNQTGSGTVEFWMYNGTYDTEAIMFGTSAGSQDIGMGIYMASSTTLAVYIGRGVTGSSRATGTANIPQNTWSHIAVTKTINGSNAELKLYVNGVLSASNTSITASDLSNSNSTQSYIRIGQNVGDENSRGWTNYYMNDLRVYNTVKYTQNFIPASTDPDILPDTPSGVAYSSTLSLVPSTDGAVGFDGSGDWLTLPGNNDFVFGAPSGSTNDFTIEGFFYLNSFAASYYVLGGVWTTGSETEEWLIQIQNNGNMRFLTTAGTSFYPANIGAGKWYHFAAVRSSSTITLYVDGVSVGSYTNSNSLGSSTKTVYWGTQNAGTWDWNGFISNIHVVKGTALYTSNFTPPTGPISSVANTKLLCCKSNSSATAFDVSPGTITANGNAVATNFNPFTVNINTQRGQESGYCTWNPLTTGSYGTISNGNLDALGASASDNGNFRGTLSFTTGKWYVEMLVLVQPATTYPTLGINPIENSRLPDNGGTNQIGYPTNSVAYEPEGYKRVSNSRSAWGSSFTVGDVIGMAVDADNGAVYYSKNGVWQQGGVPTSGATKTGAAHTWTAGSIEYVIASAQYNSSKGSFNFGQKPFKFPPPAGFQPLALANTPRPTIVRPDQYVGITTWTGNGVDGRQIGNFSFSPDFVWLKNRTNTGGVWHLLYDTVRGAANRLSSNSDSVENNQSANGYVSAFNRFGFSVTSGSVGDMDVNDPADTYVAWAWKAGGNSNTYNINDVGYATASAAGLTAGTITPSGISVSTKSGFSIVTYNSGSTTGNFTVDHGLSAVPKFIIHRTRSTGNWWVYHASVIDNLAKYLQLNSTNGTATNSANMWGGAFPTSSVFGVRVGDLIGTSQNAIAYLWAEIPGFSKFGTYSGVSSTDGPMVVTGFRPKWVLIKRTDVDTENWHIRDATRNPFNLTNRGLSPNLPNAEGVNDTTAIDILSNGFKLRGSDGAVNTGGGTYIYAAFAETPSFNLYGGQSNAR